MGPTWPNMGPIWPKIIKMGLAVGRGDAPLTRGPFDWGGPHPLGSLEC